MKSEQIIPDKIYLIYDDTPEPRATWTTKKERWDDVEFRPLERRIDIIKEFIEQVEALAEAKMLKTGKLEGAHYAAMKELAKKL